MQEDNLNHHGSCQSRNKPRNFAILGSFGGAVGIWFARGWPSGSAANHQDCESVDGFDSAKPIENIAF